MADELLRALGKRQAELPSPLQDEESELARQMLRPFDDDERADLLDSVFDRLDAEDADTDTEADADAGADAEVGTDGDAAAEGEAGSDAAPVISLETRRRRTILWVGSVAAVAAALLLWLGTTPGPDSASGGGLPVYKATRLDGGTASMRSAEAGVPTSVELPLDGTIDWVFSPRSPVRSPVTAAFLATGADRAAVLLRPSALETSPEGAIRLVGRVEEVLPLSPGTWSVRVLVGAPSQLPPTAEAAEAAVERGDWSPMAFEVKIVAAP